MVMAMRVEINAVAAVILLLLLFSKRQKDAALLDERLYDLLLVATILYAGLSTATWVMDGRPGDGMRAALQLFNVLYFLFCILVPYVWIMYAEYRLFEDINRLHALNRVLLPVMAAYAALVLATPFTGWLFYFDAQNFYCRGPLYPVQVALSLILTVFPTVRALQRLKNVTTHSARQECYTIGGFVLFPLLGLLIQVLFYGMPVAIVSTAVAELMVFINIQNRQISLDALTGINNRGQFNRYLGAQVKKERLQKKLYLMILDIDFFKSINDTYGHKAGDQALVDMANILQRACGAQGGFLSRYGGDEFAIVMEKNDQEEIDRFGADVQERVKQFNREAGRAYELSVSIGYARFGTSITPTADKLIEAADNAMYRMKEKRHQTLKQA